MPDRPIIKRTHAIHDFDITYEEIKKGWRMPYIHHHFYYEIYLLLSGERIVTIGDDHYLVCAGQATLFRSEVPHQSRGETDFTGICIHFTAELLKQYFKQSAVTQLLKCFDHPVISVPEDYLHTLLEMTRTHTWAAGDKYLKLAQILYDLNQFHKQNPYEQSVYETSSRPKASDHILEYININYTLIHSVKDISTALGISETYVYKAIQKEMHTTPKEYINQLRIHHAMHELKYSGYTVASISDSCGYQSVSYFVRVFRSFTGLSPTQYRKCSL